MGSGGGYVKKPSLRAQTKSINNVEQIRCGTLSKYTIHKLGVKSYVSVYFMALDRAAGDVHTTYAWLWCAAGRCACRQYSVMLRRALWRPL
jgi:hypothetical protein